MPRKVTLAFGLGIIAVGAVLAFYVVSYGRSHERGDLGHLGAGLVDWVPTFAACPDDLLTDHLSIVPIDGEQSDITGHALDVATAGDDYVFRSRVGLQEVALDRLRDAAGSALPSATAYVVVNHGLAGDHAPLGISMWSFNRNRLVPGTVQTDGGVITSEEWSDRHPRCAVAFD